MQPVSVAAVCLQHSIGLCIEQSGQNQRTAFACDCCKGWREFDQGTGEDIGDNQVIRCALLQHHMVSALRHTQCDSSGQLAQWNGIDRGIMLGHLDTDRIDVGCSQAGVRPQMARRKGKQAGAGADIGNMVVAKPGAAHLVQHSQTAAGGFVPACTKGLAGLNMKGYGPHGNLAHIAAGVHIKTSGMDGL